MTELLNNALKAKIKESGQLSEKFMELMCISAIQQKKKQKEKAYSLSNKCIMFIFKHQYNFTNQMTKITTLLQMTHIIKYK